MSYWEHFITMEKSKQILLNITLYIRIGKIIKDMRNC